MVKAIGFDMDDTLYDRDKVYENIFNTMQESVINVSVDFIEFNEIFQKYSLSEYDEYLKGNKSRDQYKMDRVVSAYKYFGKNINESQYIIFNSLYDYYMNKIELRSEMKELLLFLNDIDAFIFLS